MVDLSSLIHPGPYHILAYGTLLGSSIFQSFVAGITAYRALPRPQFSSLQQAIFPIYFSLQTALPLVLAVTYPGYQRLLGGPVASGPRGLLSAGGRTDLWLMGGMFVTAAANLVWAGPVTTSVMRERKHQETRDGKKSYDAGPHSAEMQKLNRRFGRMHGVSSALNMVGLGAMVGYGFVLGERL